MAEIIANLEPRLRVLEESMVKAAAGEFQDIEPEHDDLLAAIEYGFNYLIKLLRDRVDEVEQANRDLDQRVAERTHELRQKLDEIERQNALIRRQQQAIHQLSTPILQLWDRVIALPIIGIIDSHRSVELTASLLDAIAGGNGRFVILDVTGVEVVDTSTAAHLVQMVRAAELLGSTCVLTGVQPGVAQTLAGLGLDLDALTVCRNLRAGLRRCLQTLAEEQ